MSLSEDERDELERLRKHYKRSKAHEKRTSVLFGGFGFACLFSWIFPYLTPNTPFWGRVNMFGTLVCFVVWILSSYYGPFKRKKEAEGR